MKFNLFPSVIRLVLMLCFYFMLEYFVVDAPLERYSLGDVLLSYLHNIAEMTT
jgi:hypothetical protein